MLHYEISGGGKENLVLLHGFLENSTIWGEMEEELAPKFRLIKIDFPGHGQSALSDESNLESFAKNVKEVCDYLNLRKFHLLGHSMGGYVSLAYAQLFPERLLSFTLFFSTFLADSAEKKQQREKSLRIISQNFESYVNAGVPSLFNENEKDILEGKITMAKRIALTTDPAGAVNAVKAMMTRPDRTRTVEEFRGKILILAGRHDTAVNSEELSKAVPDRTNVKVYTLDCGHNGHWEKPDICAAIIRAELLHNLPKDYVF